MRKSKLRLSSQTLAFVLTFSVALVLYLYNLNGWPLEDDENKYIYAAWRVAENEVPGRDFLIAQPPPFLYAGAIIVRLCSGPSLRTLAVLRGLSVAAILLASVFVCLTAKTVWNARVGWLAMVIFLLNSQVFINGRLFRPDTLMLIFTTAGTYLFICAMAHQKSWLFGGAGFLFGVAAAIKLFGFLAWGGCVLYLLYRFLSKKLSMRDALVSFMQLGMPAATVVGISYGFFYSLSPRLLEGVLGSHVKQIKPDLLIILMQPLVLYGLFVKQQFALLLVIPAVDRLRRYGHSLASVYLWQLPTALLFFFWGRSLFLRHLLYLVPTLAALLAWLIDAGLRWAEKSLIQDERPPGRAEGWLLGLYRALWIRGLSSVAVVGLLAIVVVQPLIETILPVAIRRETETLALAEYITEHTGEDDCVLAEYAGLNFFARRRSIYYGPFISWGAASSGVISSEHLIDEVKAKRVRMVLFAVGTPFQLNSMPDFETFRTYVREHYDFMGTFQRVDQTFELYFASELDQEIMP
jgi:4-amino-4-deoxy-L-arabinose transferase-like glycosyltransferase